MGWSATAKACEVERRWSEVCVSQTGMQNRYRGKDGKTYFYQMGREQDDGAIVGQTFLINDEMTLSWKKGNWRIEPDGRVTRKPTAFPA